MRLHNLLERGFIMPIGRLERWQEDALLVIADELRPRPAPPDLGL